ncbi:hypothetical protein OCU04_005854 [Sclerotinia nivalis]|uniref:3',5'-cyclic-nucleotide phosphodiesterase n=1 Tax=Sclerotinia nivalis TaxID=352851 RepID=A0A9X0ALS6_9HELO|nr:hypothetical protein OCU04_005854 [Sclerotinia nivalis]
MADDTQSEDGKGKGDSLQVIVLGSGGGPLEDNCTAFLVRSIAQGWTRGSVLAVDAGVHLSAIQTLLQQYHPLPPERPHVLQDGLLAGLELPYRSVGANTAHIARNLIGAHLITHPHIDHIAGGVVSTASPSSKPRRIAGLASTIEALKQHVFNDVIWPNLTDENGGVGLVTFMRLMSGGSSLLGDGVTKGYMEVVEGLGVKSWAVSHGLCLKQFPYQSLNNPTAETGLARSPSRRANPQSSRGHPSPPLIADAMNTATENLGMNFPSPAVDPFRVYTSSAFFIHDIASSHEILIWGDVEPDSLSAFPRNKQVWQDAAPKIAAGTLKGIFIECSYDDSRSAEMLFGHLTPRYLIEELKVLAAEVDKFRGELSPRRRPRDRFITQGRVSGPDPSSRLDYLRRSIASRERDRIAGARQSLATSANYIFSHRKGSNVGSLDGVKVVIIHVKDTLDDKEDPKEVILRELGNHEEELNLGCEFVVSEKGMSVCL